MRICERLVLSRNDQAPYIDLPVAQRNMESCSDGESATQLDLRKVCSEGAAPKLETGDLLNLELPLTVDLS